MHYIEKFKTINYAIILIIILGSLLGWSQSGISTATEWLIAIGISIIISGMCGELIENLSGDLFKTIFIIIPIAGFNFSISLFPILTFILKKWLFG